MVQNLETSMVDPYLRASSPSPCPGYMLGHHGIILCEASAQEASNVTLNLWVK